MKEIPFLKLQQQKKKNVVPIFLHTDPLTVLKSIAKQQPALTGCRWGVGRGQGWVRCPNTFSTKKKKSHICKCRYLQWVIHTKALIRYYNTPVRIAKLQKIWKYPVFARIMEQLVFTFNYVRKYKQAHWETIWQFLIKLSSYLSMT